MKFADFYKHKRSRISSLSGFCRDNGLLKSYVCNLEKGKKSPPRDPSVLARHAKALGLEPNTDDWYKFHDLAAVENGVLPVYMLKSRKGKLLEEFSRMRASLKIQQAN